MMGPYNVQSQSCRIKVGGGSRAQNAEKEELHGQPLVRDEVDRSADERV